MRSFADVTRLEPSDDDERATLAHVIEVAVAYQRGELGVESAMAQTTKEERRFAIRCLALPGPSKAAVMALLDGIIAAQGKYETKHGTFSKEDLAFRGAKLVRNWEGKRAIVFPLCWMNDEPIYPPYHMPSGDDRREIEARINADYQKYRNKKKGRPG